MLFQRVKPLDKILETAEKKSLKRQLGAFQPDRAAARRQHAH